MESIALKHKKGQLVKKKKKRETIDKIRLEREVQTLKELTQK
jgi:hypothetical protein